MLKQKILIQFGSNIFLKIIGMISGVVVARIAGPEVMGILSYSTAYVSIFLFITGLFSTSHIKLISEKQNLGNCIRTYTVLQLGSITLFSFVVLFWFFFQKFVLNYQFESSLIEQIIMITLAAVVFTKLVDFNNSSYTAKLEQTKANYPNVIRGFLFQIGKILVVLLGFRALGLATWNLVTSIIILPLSFRLYNKFPAGKFDKDIAKKYFKIAIPIFLIVIINSLIAWSDRLILHHFTNSVELGYFAAAFSLGGMILIISGSIGKVFFPLFSSLIKDNNWKSINNRINTYETFVTTFIFPFICLLAIISEPIIVTLLGDKYQESVVPFTIIIFASYFSIVGMPYGNIITGMGKFYLSALLNLCKFSIYIVAIIYFVSPDFLGLGAIGLALNLLIVNLVNNILFFLVSKKIGEIKIDFANLIRYALIASFSFILYYFSPLFADNVDLWWLYLIPFYLVLIFGLLYLTKLLKLMQVKELLHLINLKNTFRYIKKEINE